MYENNLVNAPSTTRVPGKQSSGWALRRMGVEWRATPLLFQSQCSRIRGDCIVDDLIVRTYKSNNYNYVLPPSYIIWDTLIWHEF